METTSQSKQSEPTEPKKRRSQVIQILKYHDLLLKRIDRRTRMLAAGLRELFMLGEDYIHMVACEDDIDVALLNALRQAGATGRQSGELADILGINYRYVSHRIHRMNKKMEQEIGEIIIEKHGHKWKLIPRLRKDFAETRAEKRAETEF